MIGLGHAQHGHKGKDISGGGRRKDGREIEPYGQDGGQNGPGTVVPPFTAHLHGTASTDASETRRGPPRNGLSSNTRLISGGNPNGMRARPALLRARFLDFEP